ncbi:MAG: serine/threonine protein phosphatase, partial [Myxococcales bacterium]
MRPPVSSAPRGPVVMLPTNFRPAPAPPAPAPPAPPRRARYRRAHLFHLLGPGHA